MSLKTIRIRIRNAIRNFHQKYRENTILFYSILFVVILLSLMFYFLTPVFPDVTPVWRIIIITAVIAFVCFITYLCMTIIFCNRREHPDFTARVNVTPGLVAEPYGENLNPPILPEILPKPVKFNAQQQAVYLGLGSPPGSLFQHSDISQIPSYEQETGNVMIRTEPPNYETTAVQLEAQRSHTDQSQYDFQLASTSYANYGAIPKKTLYKTPKKSSQSSSFQRPDDPIDIRGESYSYGTVTDGQRQLRRSPRISTGPTYSALTPRRSERNVKEKLSPEPRHITKNSTSDETRRKRRNI